MGYIYKITNKINGKIYIGKTVDTIQKRFNDHIYNAYAGFKDAPYLANAILKYGKENFYVEEIEKCLDEELDDKEIFWIKELKSHYSTGLGYNISLGGNSHYIYSDEDLLLLWEQGYNITQISSILGICTLSCSERLHGLIEDKEIKERRYSSISIPVCQYDIYGNFIKEYSSAKEAGEFLKIKPSLITKCCKKQSVITHNYFFKYKSDLTPIEDFINNYAKSPHCTSVNMIDINTNIVLKTYPSANQATLELKLSSGQISSVCNHKKGYETAGGYKWEWAYQPKRDLFNINKQNDS